MEGEQPHDCHILLEGLVFRYKALGDGSRQILSLHVAGDIYDTQHFIVPEADYSICTLTSCRVALVSHHEIETLVERFPRIARALWKETLIEAAIFREWITNLGRRTAYGRIAHLICEMYARLNAVGLARDFTIEWPLTQEQIGDSQGLSTVHVNRSMQELRRAGLIETPRKKLVIKNWDGLQFAADFNPAYLRLPRNAVDADESVISRPIVCAQAPSP